MAKPPLKASPAPVVSTTGPADIAGTSAERPCPWSSAPALAERHHHRADAPLAQPLGRRPRRLDVADRHAGQRLGLGLVRRDVVAEREHRVVGSSRPGAGFRIVVTPLPRAISSAAHRRVQRLLELGDEDRRAGDQPRLRVEVGGRDGGRGPGADDDGVVAGGLLDEDVGGAGVAVGARASPPG